MTAATTGATRGPTTTAAELLDRAAAARTDAPAVLAHLVEHRQRLDEPLRLAVAGRAKAGKSTLLNALVGAVVAATDAGECTRVVTWYRHGSRPAAVRHDTDGRSRPLPVHEDGGELRVELPDAAADEVDRLVVDCPADRLAGMTLIDTPGLSSLSPAAAARTGGLVTPADGAVSGADALLFLTRQVHAEDAAFLTGFQSGPGAGGAHAATLTVLSRADEIGSARMDALRSASRIARRTAAEPALRATGSAVLPVAGLVALFGRTLRPGELVALRALAAMPPAELEGLLLSADRFVRPTSTSVLLPAMRARLLARLGLFGTRLAASLLREGADDAASLADELVRRSGLADLERAIDVQVRARAEQLRTRSALAGLEVALRAAPRAGDAALWAGLEELRTGSHHLPELDLLAGLGAPSSPVAAELRAEATRLLGGAGTSPAQRLGRPDGTPPDELRGDAGTALAAWQARAVDPLAPRAATAAAAVVVRSIEGVLHELAGSAAAGAPPQPAAGAAGGQQRRTGEGQRAHGEQRVPVDLRAPGDDAADDQGHWDGGGGDSGRAPAGPGAPVQQQGQADAPEDDEDADGRQRRRQRHRDAVAQQRGRGRRVLGRRVGGEPGA